MGYPTIERSVEKYLLKPASPPTPLRIPVLRSYDHYNHIYTDRDYINEFTKDGPLIGMALVQLPRHYKEDIVIELGEPVTIYRPTCNMNKEMYADWTVADFIVSISGNPMSRNHSNVVMKKFDPQVLKLPSGGPQAAHPIFIDPPEGSTKTFFVVQPN